MKVENNKSKNPDEFISRYQSEVLINVAEIHECIGKITKNPDDPSLLFQEIKNRCIAVSDLAMVYGYEGVELIGYRIIQTLDNYDKNGDIEVLLSHLNAATKAIEEAMFLIDERKERELIRELNKKTKIAEKFEPDINQSATMENDDEFLFDIREDEKLISLLSDADGQAVELGQKDEIDGDLDNIDVNSILGEHYSNLDFDIPKPGSKNKQGNVDINGDAKTLELDFKKTKENSEGNKNRIIKKIGNFLGFKKKNRISFQD